MKSPDDIQRAHDLLRWLMVDETLADQVFTAGSLPLISAAEDVLCWVLGHTHNTTFAENLRTIEMRLEALGIRLVELPEMVYPQE